MSRATWTMIGIAGVAAGCSSAVDTDWKAVDELHGRVGTVSTLEPGDGLVVRPRRDPPSDREAALARRARHGTG